ncbi:MAG TPA: helix-turn-helix transcriptional regulator [Actinophytocola sp.]|jgi:transcriptional regulator with XRE-family HTH domain|nr:helix-turn-helix transcriptional regulator [Actinophytocola sp.]
MTVSTVAVRNKQPDHDSEHDNLLHALGDELRQARKQHDWSRRQLQSRLATDVAMQTLASYELGTRHYSVTRFVEMCAALEVPGPTVLRSALRRVAAAEVGCLNVDLQPVIHDNGCELFPFRRWAQQRIVANPECPTDISLKAPAVDRLAELCGLTTGELVARLTALGAVRGS